MILHSSFFTLHLLRFCKNIANFILERTAIAAVHHALIDD